MIQTKEELIELIERSGAANVKMIRFSSNLRYRNGEHMAVVEEVEFWGPGEKEVVLDGDVIPETPWCSHGVMYQPEAGLFYCEVCHKEYVLPEKESP